MPEKKVRDTFFFPASMMDFPSHAIIPANVLKSVDQTTAGNGTVIIQCPSGIRFVVTHISIIAANTAVQAGTYVLVDAVIQGAGNHICGVKIIPSVATVSNIVMDNPGGLIVDSGSSITLATDALQFVVSVAGYFVTGRGENT